MQGWTSEGPRSGYSEEEDDDQSERAQGEGREEEGEQSEQGEDADLSAEEDGETETVRDATRAYASDPVDLRSACDLGWPPLNGATQLAQAHRITQFLRRVCDLATDARSPEMHPPDLDPARFQAWLDDLERRLFAGRQVLRAYSPGYWNGETLLWTTLGALWVIPRHARAQQISWLNAFDAGILATDLPYVRLNSLALSAHIPIRGYTVELVTSSVYALCARFAELEWCIALEQWVLLLRHRIWQIVHDPPPPTGSTPSAVTSRASIYDSPEYCEEVSPDGPTGTEPKYTRVTSEWVVEMARIICAAQHEFYRYRRSSPRMLPVMNARRGGDLLHRSTPLGLPSPHEHECATEVPQDPPSSTPWTDRYASCRAQRRRFLPRRPRLFEAVIEPPTANDDESIHPAITVQWQSFVTVNLKQYYRPELTKLLKDHWCSQYLRPGEAERASDARTGVRANPSDVVLRERHSGFVDYLSGDNGVEASETALFARIVRLDPEPADPVADAATLALLEQYLLQLSGTGLRNLFCFQSHDWSVHPEALDAYLYPIIIQCAGGWDVKYGPHVFQCRLVSIAFIVWVFAMSDPEINEHFPFDSPAQHLATLLPQVIRRFFTTRPSTGSSSGHSGESRID